MKRFIAIVNKELWHIFRDGRSLLLLFCMPVVLVVLFGFAITTEVRQAGIGILDKSQDAVTTALRNKILASEYFMLAGSAASEQELEAAFRQGLIQVAVVFGSNFSHDLEKYGQASVQIITDATEPNTAHTLTSYLNAIIQEYQQRMNSRQVMPLQISTQTRMLYNPRLESTFYFVPGVITVILLLVSAMMTSVTIAREKEFGNMEVLLVSPVNPVVIILGKAAPYILLALLNAVSIMSLGYFLFGIPLAGSLWLLLLECLLFVLTCLSLGILISTITDMQQTALLASLMGLMMPSVLLSGFIFPLESMPEVLQWLSHLIPSKWFIIIAKAIMLKGVGLEVVWQETLVLAGMTILLIMASIARFRIRLE